MYFRNVLCTVAFATLASAAVAKQIPTPYSSDPWDEPAATDSDDLVAREAEAEAEPARTAAWKAAHGGPAPEYKFGENSGDDSAWHIARDAAEEGIEKLKSLLGAKTGEAVDPNDHDFDDDDEYDDSDSEIIQERDVPPLSAEELAEYERTRDVVEEDEDLEGYDADVLQRREAGGEEAEGLSEEEGEDDEEFGADGLEERDVEGDDDYEGEDDYDGPPPGPPVEIPEFSENTRRAIDEEEDLDLDDDTEENRYGFATEEERLARRGVEEELDLDDDVDYSLDGLGGAPVYARSAPEDEEDLDLDDDTEENRYGFATEEERLARGDVEEELDLDDDVKIDYSAPLEARDVEDDDEEPDYDEPELDWSASEVQERDVDAETLEDEDDKDDGADAAYAGEDVVEEMQASAVEAEDGTETEDAPAALSRRFLDMFGL